MADIYGTPIYESSIMDEAVPSTQRPSDPFNTPRSLTWTELVASTSEDWGGFSIANGSFDQKGILFIATGTAGNESIIASMPTSVSGRDAALKIYVPIPVSSGTRVSAAVARSTTAAATLYIQLHAVKSSAFSATPSWTVMDSGPYNLTDTEADYGQMLSVDPGATALTWSAYTDLALTTGNSANNVINGDSLDNSYDWIGVMMMDNDDNSQSTSRRRFNAAIGGPGSEVDFIADVAQRYDGGEVQYTSPLWSPAGASGTDRITVKCMSSSTEATDRVSAFLMFGLR